MHPIMRLETGQHSALSDANTTPCRGLAVLAPSLSLDETIPLPSSLRTKDLGSAIRRSSIRGTRASWQIAASTTAQYFGQLLTIANRIACIVDKCNARDTVTSIHI
jgi:hypothetical protein